MPPLRACRNDAGRVGHRVEVNQRVVVGAVDFAFHQAQQARADKRHDEVDHADDGERFEELVVDARRAVGFIIKLRHTDDVQHGGILDVDDQVVADLRQDDAEGLRQDDAFHRLPVRHAERLRGLGLPGVDGLECRRARIPPYRRPC